MSGYCRGRNASLQPLKRFLHGASIAQSQIKCITSLGSEVGAMPISLHAASICYHAWWAWGMLADGDKGTGNLYMPLISGLRSDKG